MVPITLVQIRGISGLNAAVGLCYQDVDLSQCQLPARLFEDDDYVSFLVSGFDVPVSLGDLG